MSKTQVCEIRCEHCRTWFPSPIYFGDSESFDTATLSGNRFQCPACGKMSGCNKENLRLRFADGGFSGDKT